MLQIGLESHGLEDLIIEYVEACIRKSNDHKKPKFRKLAPAIEESSAFERFSPRKFINANLNPFLAKFGIDFFKDQAMTSYLLQCLTLDTILNYRNTGN